MQAEELGAEVCAPAFVVAEKPAVVEAPEEENHWTARLLAPGKEDDATVLVEARRFAAGLGLAAIYGVAASARQGGLAFVKGAALVPAALLAAAAFGLPALNIALALVDAPLAPRRLFAAASRATAAAGIALAGLAPVALLYVVTSGNPFGAAVAAAIGLVVGSLTGLRALGREIAAEVTGARELVRLVTIVALLAFSVFAAAVGARVWMHLPVMLPGGR